MFENIVRTDRLSPADVLASRYHNTGENNDDATDTVDNVDDTNMDALSHDSADYDSPVENILLPSDLVHGGTSNMECVPASRTSSASASSSSSD